MSNLIHIVLCIVPGDDRTIDVHIKRLRERFATTPDFRIETVRGLGYRLEVYE